jgi:hypothetical protein
VASCAQYEYNTGAVAGKAMRVQRTATSQVHTRVILGLLIKNDGFQLDALEAIRSQVHTRVTLGLLIKYDGFQCLPYILTMRAGPRSEGTVG